MMTQFLTMFKLFAKKSLGQNFLINPGVVQKIIAAANLNADDIVLEVGPGTGVLTAALAVGARRVIAVEKDRRLINDLEEKFKNSNVEIIEEDILALDVSRFKFQDSSFKIVANLPYYITSHFIRNVFGSASWQTARPKLLVLMVQKEVAQRMTATPPDMNLLALSVQYFSKPEIITYVSAGSFRPIPSVDSAVIKLTPKSELALTPEKQAQLFSILRSVFAGKRKQLVNTLQDALNLDKDRVSALLTRALIVPQARPETLSLEDWLVLVNRL